MAVIAPFQARSVREPSAIWLKLTRRAPMTQHGQARPRASRGWPATYLDKSMGSSINVVSSVSENRSKRRKQEKPREHQRRAYMTWKESCVADWLESLKMEKEPPNEERMKFVVRVIERCRNESLCLKRPGKKYQERARSRLLIGHTWRRKKHLHKT